MIFNDPKLLIKLSCRVKHDASHKFSI